MNKNGSILDWFFIMMVMFMIGVSVIVAYIVMNAASASTLWDDAPEAREAIDITSNTILMFDNLMLFAIVGMSIFVLISSALIWNHPSFFIVSFFLLLVAIMVSATMANAFWDFTNTATILSASSNFPKIKFIIEQMPFYVTFMFLASAITMYVSFSRQ